MRRLAVIALAALPLAAGCAEHPPYEPRTACRLVLESRAQLPRMSPGELYELSFGTPAYADAKSAYAQRLSATVVGGIGAVGLVGGLVAGFATDSSQPAARTAGYSVVGGAIGLFALTLVLGFTSRGTAERARAALIRFGAHCE